MAKRIDIIGQTFGELTVISESQDRKYGNKNQYYVLCNCSCGNTDIPAYPSELSFGQKTSCGCIRGRNGSSHKKAEWGMSKEQIKSCQDLKRFLSIMDGVIYA